MNLEAKIKRFKVLGFWETFFSGHISVGPVTIFGANAMAWAVNIRSKKWGYICFSLPSINPLRKRMGHYFYLSPNATPWASTLYLGRWKDERARAVLRRSLFGHNFNTDEHYKELRFINEYLPDLIKQFEDYGLKLTADDA